MNDLLKKLFKEPSEEDKLLMKKVDIVTKMIKENMSDALERNLTIANSFITLLQFLKQESDYSEFLSKIKTRYNDQKTELLTSENSFIHDILLPKILEEFGVEIDLN